MISFPIIIALLIGLGAGIAIAGDHVTQRAHLYCRNCNAKPAWPTVIQVTPRSTRREKRRLRRARRDLNRSLTERMN